MSRLTTGGGDIHVPGQQRGTFRPDGTRAWGRTEATLPQASRRN